MADIPLKKVLIVDDEKEIVDSISEIIRHDENSHYKFDITKCYDGANACEAIHHKQFDVIFIDRIMPGLRGEQIIERIRGERGPNQYTPIVMVSGMLMTLEEDLEAERFEKVYFIEKPFKADKLLRVLNLFLNAA